MPSIDTEPKDISEYSDAGRRESSDVSSPDDGSAIASVQEVQEVIDHSAGRDALDLSGSPVERANQDDSASIPPNELDAPIDGKLTVDTRHIGNIALGDTPVTLQDAESHTAGKNTSIEADDDKYAEAAGFTVTEGPEVAELMDASESDGGDDGDGNNKPPDDKGKPSGDDSEGDDDGDKGASGKPVKKSIDDKAREHKLLVAAWQETRTRAEIEALKDPDQYTNENLVVRWQGGDPEALQALFVRNERFFRLKAARNTWTDEHGSFDEVEQQYKLLFLKSLYNFDEAKGANVLTYAGNIAEKELRNGREPARDKTGAQPAVRWQERRLFALENLLIQTGGHTELTEDDLSRFRFTDEQKAAVKIVEARVRDTGVTRLTDDEVRYIFNRADLPSEDPRHMTEGSMQGIRHHTLLTTRMLSLDHIGADSSASIWLGRFIGKYSADEHSSHVRPIREAKQVSVDELVEEEMVMLGLKAVLPIALETLSPKEREILYQRTILDNTLEKTAEILSEQGEDITRERVRQVYAGIVDPSRSGSARAELFRYMLSRATGYQIAGQSAESARKVDTIVHAREEMSRHLPYMPNDTKTVLNEYFLLDNRYATSTPSAIQIARDHGMRTDEVNRIINMCVSVYTEDLDVGGMRQAMLDYAPVRHPLSEEEKRKWGVS